MALKVKAGSGFDLQPENSIGYLVRDASRLLLRRLGHWIEPHGLTLGQYFLLRELWEGDGLTSGELSVRVGTLDPSTVNMLDQLEARNYVKRTRSEVDRRKVIVTLTPAGRKLRATVLGDSIEVNECALAGFSDSEIDGLRAMLKRIKRNLLDAPPPEHISAR